MSSYLALDSAENCMLALVAKKKIVPPNFGQRLRELRHDVGLTQTELGERSGFYYQDIAKFERSVSEPLWTSVLRLAKALDVTPDAFLGKGDLD